MGKTVQVAFDAHRNYILLNGGGGGQFAEHTLNVWVKQICFKRLNLKFHIYCLVIFDGLNLLHGFAWRQHLLVNLHFSLNCQIIGPKFHICYQSLQFAKKNLRSHRILSYG